MAFSLPSRIVGLKLIVDSNVEIAPILQVGFHGNRRRYPLAGRYGEHVLEVEDGLLPVGVLGVGAGGEPDGLVAFGELDVEPGDEGVDEIVAAAAEFEGDLEVEIGCGALVEIEDENGRGFSHNGLELDGVDEGLGEGGLLERSVVESVDVIPDFGWVMLEIWRLRQARLRALRNCGSSGGYSHPIFSSLYSPSSMPAA